MERDYIGKKQKGVTFIEAVISILFLSIAIGAIIGAFVICRASAATVRHRALAVNLARARIENIKSLAYPQIPAQTGVESIAIDQGLSGDRTTTVSDVYSNAKMYKITVTVSWTEISRSLTEQVATLISQH